MGDEGKEVVEAQEKRKASGGGFFSAISAKFMGRSADKAPKEPAAAAQQQPQQQQQQQQHPPHPPIPSANAAQPEDAEQAQQQQQQQQQQQLSQEPRQTSTYEETLRDLSDQFSQLKANSQLTVEKFDLRDTLGTGTFGRVRLVTYVHKGRPHHLALKMMKKSLVLQLKQVEHIRAERGILTQIKHPFIVNLLGTFQDDHRLFMVMEYVIGGELFSLLGNVGRLQHQNAQFYAAEIALAFEYLHSLDIVYRDLKPENLLIDREGHMKIADFGFAKRLRSEDSYRTWTLCGTPEYLAPEIIQSKGHGKAVDWWALGILIYEMLAGFAPFYADEPYGIYRKILDGRIKYPSHFSEEAQSIVGQLCTADRSKRLGCGKDGAQEVKRHPWFRGVDWDAMLRREVKVPYMPEVSAPDDTRNFDKYDEGGDGVFPALTAEEQDLFAGF